ncbi:hypothetical protein BBF96_08245 [Anoxybacter fermentans]|uniref:Glycerophosphoryl diester phosphodiesterase membrane domain-containing protein n=1 Tax=Anoxybacter fermentans TaxID=1323375 RepID=A0A3S9SYF4_9FIRM|nr:hypothetical protein [Anoxybacter fermentans]AZR73373.1 hypothetical protein BBF96_08245 [Anoxybacter fermentans]
MTIKKFSVQDALRFGWDTLTSNFLFFLGILIVVALIGLLPNFFGILMEETVFLGTIGVIASIVLSVIVYLGLIKISLMFCDNTKGKFADLFSTFPLFFKYISGLILYRLIVMVGFFVICHSWNYMVDKIQIF